MEKFKDFVDEIKISPSGCLSKRISKQKEDDQNRTSFLLQKIK